MPDPLRYVVLHHTGIPDPHYDLMFERHPGGPLQTFRSPAWPIKTSTPIEPLPEHRREYLDYQGELTGNRGSVRRIESGTYESSASARTPSVRVLVLLDTHVRLRLVTDPPAEPSIEPAD